MTMPGRASRCGELRIVGVKHLAALPAARDHWLAGGRSQHLEHGIAAVREAEAGPPMGDRAKLETLEFEHRDPQMTTHHYVIEACDIGCCQHRSPGLRCESKGEEPVTCTRVCATTWTRRASASSTDRTARSRGQ